MIKHKIGLIGIGNMGTSILEGALRKKVITQYNIMGYDKIQKKLKDFSTRTHIRIAKDLRELFTKCDLILLAIKPQDFVSFAAENKQFLRKNSCIVSILAGLAIEDIRQALGKVQIIRAMPNLGAKVGESMTVLCGQNKKWLRTAEKLFLGCGEVAVLPEKAFDAVTAISGSGPAYFFHLMELLSDFGTKQKIPAKVAARLAVQTGLGAALLAKTSELPCVELRRMVTSKKGTTEAALKMLAKKRFGTIFKSALEAAVKRSRQLRQ